MKNFLDRLSSRVRVESHVVKHAIAQAVDVESLSSFCPFNGL